MNVLLITLPQTMLLARLVYPAPLGFGYIASVLRSAGHKIKIHDLMLRKKPLALTVLIL